MTNKKLTERLHQELDELGVPALMTERVRVCSKLFQLPKFKIEALLHGVVALDANSMQKIAEELEVSTDWLFAGAKGKAKH
ncbi:hypothetical protein OQJ18_14240 [Fluoribacter dumoffii]|uniref:HTH cro/C1-type domain-containing protein n=1 Tax=Fluoribacter dumoffii TaxID=463 RepID=A0A377GDC4_9GAMM|nr:hypothetical protein [Fluoribacter dumoffii]KTC91132.1 hypothetical protein Ldum_2200 [Fluoribacter dumoffii NY 23]MCW8387700.1 hypothetical protein [Fluoribacter dumoffii]MCW8416741.1 hypothetical protein [Fluoribacter dumoffii]MCW8455419.1 hypothetical protein [Fluoribacter dumoffii]MCW8460503.1 hypothetical protein [Fluoribacter dumoffii]